MTIATIKMDSRLENVVNKISVMNMEERAVAFLNACRSFMDFKNPDAQHYITFLGKVVSPEVSAQGAKLMVEAATQAFKKK